MTDPFHILIVDDETQIRTMLRRYLTAEGFKVSDVPDGTEMRLLMKREAVDLILLDLMLPGEDGLSLARHVRQNSDIPIIMLTGKGDVIDRVAGLEAGADDYIAKPFHLREVLARIRTVTRRGTPRTAASTATAQTPAEKQSDAVRLFEGWRFDTLKRELLRPDGTVVSLTSSEFELLGVFVSHPGRVLSRDQLMEIAKGREWAAFDRAVDTQVGRLRKKIESDPGNPSLIKTVRGAGYVFSATVTSA